MMPLILYPDIDKLLIDLLGQICQILDEKLVGLYLYGSLVTGDFDPGISDFDLLAATATDIDNQEFDRLQELHLDFVNDHPEWANRVEIAYLSVAGLKTFKTKVSQMAVISPGEPFHFKEAGKEWLLNWWQVRGRGLALYGPDPKTLIDPISQKEFLDVVREHAQQWREWVRESRHRKSQAYVRLTMCRALYAVKNGEQVSKRQAALWARDRFPEHARLIEQALEWRKAEENEEIDHEATFPETERFVHFMIDQVEKAATRETTDVQQVLIKLFRSEDQEDVKRLILAGLGAHWGTVDPTLNPDLNDISTSYAEATFLVAWLDSKIVGTGALIPKSDQVAEIVRMSVAADLQRHGIGTQILEQLVHKAQGLDFRRVVLETTTTWHEVIEFYKRFGFRITHRQDGEFGGEVHFALDLTSAE
ncbi:MAG: GNAT family N-acetyltransferase [Proteobacteria bacterium]|nr:GNAT family N-acetyltransferase [Pseudomonadota bacterium]